MQHTGHTGVVLLPWAQNQAKQGLWVDVCGGGCLWMQSGPGSREGPLVFFSFFFLSIYYLSVCVYYVCANMCCGVHVEVRGQLRVVGSPFLPLYRFWR